MTELDEATQRRLKAFVEQVQSAGFDLDTVEGRNEYRATLEFANRQKTRCEQVGQRALFWVLAFTLAGAGTVFVLGLKAWIGNVAGK